MSDVCVADLSSTIGGFGGFENIISACKAWNSSSCRSSSSLLRIVERDVQIADFTRQLVDIQDSRQNDIEKSEQLLAKTTREFEQIQNELNLQVDTLQTTTSSLEAEIQIIELARNEKENEFKRIIESLKKEVECYNLTISESKTSHDIELLNQKDIISSKDCAISELELKIQKVVDEYTAAKVEFNEMQNQNSGTITSTKHEFSLLSMRLSHANEELHEHTLLLSKKSDEHELLQSEHKQTVAALHEKHDAESREFKARIVQIQTQKIDLESRANELVFSLEKLSDEDKSQVFALKEELAITRDQLSEIFEQNKLIEADLEAKSHAHENVVSTMTLKLQELDRMMDVADEQFLNEKEDLQSTISVRDAALNTLQLALDAAASNHTAVLAELRLQMQVFDSTSASTKQELSTLKQFFDLEKLKLEQELSQSFVDNRKQMFKLEDLQHQLDVLNCEKENVQNLMNVQGQKAAESSNSLQGTLSQLQLTNNALSENLEAEKQIIGTKAREIQSLSQTLDSLNYKCEILEARISAQVSIILDQDAFNLLLSGHEALLTDEQDNDFETLLSFGKADLCDTETRLNLYRSASLASQSQYEQLYSQSAFFEAALDDSTKLMDALRLENKRLNSLNLQKSEMVFEYRNQITDSKSCHNKLQSSLIQEVQNNKYLHKQFASLYNHLELSHNELFESQQETEQALDELNMSSMKFESQHEALLLELKLAQKASIQETSSLKAELENQKLVVKMTNVELQSALQLNTIKTEKCLKSENLVQALELKIKEIDAVNKAALLENQQLSKKVVEIEAILSESTNTLHQYQGKCDLLTEKHEIGETHRHTLLAQLEDMDVKLEIKGKEFNTQTDEMAVLEKRFLADFDEAQQSIANLGAKLEDSDAELKAKSLLCLESAKELRVNQDIVLQLEMKVQEQQQLTINAASQLNAASTELKNITIVHEIKCEEFDKLNSELMHERNQLSEAVNNVSIKASELESARIKVKGLLEMVEFKTHELDTAVESFDTQIKELKFSHAEESSMMQSQFQSSVDEIEEKLQESVKVHNTLLESSKNTEAEHSLARSTMAELQALYSSKESNFTQSEQKSVHYENEMENLRLNTKKEFAEQTSKTSALQQKLKIESANFESTVQDLSMRLAAKTKDLKQALLERADAQNTIDMVELKFQNEVASRDLQIKHLEAKAKDQLRQAEMLKLKYSKAEHELIKFQTEHSGAQEMLDLLQKEQQVAKEEKKATLQMQAEWEKKIVETEAQLNDWASEVDRTCADMKENFESQLQMLTMRGKLNDSEVKKLGELNAELFGHSNNRQKIKHVAQLKEENVNLKKANLKFSRQLDDLKRKLMTLEREVETLRSVGTVRKLSKVARHAVLGNSFIGRASESKQAVQPEDLSDKENSFLIEQGMGGISFVI